MGCGARRPSPRSTRRSSHGCCLAKGYYANKSKLYRAAKESVDTALKYAFVGRRRKKRDFRRLWIVRINAAAREHGLTYGQFINGLKEIDKSIMLLYLDDKSYKEIAEITGITESNVATKINRIKDKLKSNFLTL